MAHEAPSTDIFIPATMERSTCKKHKAEINEPCYRLGDGVGVCNARAKRAGFDHPVSDKSRLNRVGTNEARRKGR